MSGKGKGKDYFAKMQSARIYQGNVGFMDKTANMPFMFRIRFAWDILKGVNPVTGKLVSRGGVRDNLRNLNNGR